MVLQNYTKKNNYILLVLLAGGLLGTLSQNLLTSALPVIMKEFSVGELILLDKFLEH